jgi:hypothetical protein
MEIGMTTTGMARSSSLEESQRSINDETFEFGETTLGFSFILTPCATMLASNVVVLDVRTIS